ncbi:MAG: ATP-binding protein [Streptosporangiaceae bacterium]
MTTDDLNLILLASPMTAGLTRSLVTQRLLKWGLCHISDDVLLIVSELVVNACEAAPNSEIKLHLSRGPAGLLTQVWDPSPFAPAAKPLTHLTFEAIDAAPTGTWDDGGGWGLPIVAALSTDCGYRPTPPLGKWVWSHITC